MESQRVFCGRLASKYVRFNYRFAVPVGLLLAVEGVVLLSFQLNYGVGALLFAWGLWMIVSRLIFWPIRMKKEYEQYPDLERTMEFREEGLTAQTSYGKGEVQWTRFTRFAETENVVVLLALPRSLYTVPKRAFTADELEQFRRLLQQKISVR